MDYNIEWRDVARAQCVVLQSQKAVTALLESEQLLPFGFAQHSCSDVRWLAKEEGYCWCEVTTYTATQHPPAAAAAGSAASQTRAGLAVVEGGFSHTTPNDVLPDHSHRILYHLGQYLSADNVVELHWSRLSLSHSVSDCRLSQVCRVAGCHLSLNCRVPGCHLSRSCRWSGCHLSRSCHVSGCHLSGCHVSPSCRVSSVTEGEFSV